jgi:inosose dehydratase
MEHQRGWTRRKVICVAAAGFAAPAQGAKQRNIRWALGAVTWTAKAGGRMVRWSEILPDIQAGGFEGFEPFTTASLPVNDENMAELERLAPSYGLQMAAIYWGDQFHRVDQRERLRKECHRFLGYLKRFRCDRLVLGPPSPNVPDEREAIRNMAAMVNEIGEVALREYGVKAAIHPHVGGLIENPRQIDHLMRETDPRYFNLAPDTAQLWMGGADPVEVFEKHQRRLVYIHYKDIRGYHRGLPGYMDNVIELGRGVIEFPALHRILKRIHYRGWITIDLDNARVSPLESARIQREYITRVLEPIYL